MLNRVVIMGRITRELELKQTGGTSVIQFPVAVERNFANKNGERETDFINVVAWRQTAEFIAKYFGKGRMIAVDGQLRTRTYEDKNGVTHYVTEVYADNVSFTGEARQQDGADKTRQNRNGGNPYFAGTSQPPDQRQQGKPQNDDFSDFEEAYSDGDVPF